MSVSMCRCRDPTHSSDFDDSYVNRFVLALQSPQKENITTIKIYHDNNHTPYCQYEKNKNRRTMSSGVSLNKY